MGANSAKAEIEYSIQGYYGSQYGWEELTAEESFVEAKVQLKCYNENEPEIRHRIKRQKITE